MGGSTVIRNDVILSLMRAGLYRGQPALDDETYEPVSLDFVNGAALAFPSFLPNELCSTLNVGGGKEVAVAKWIAEVFDCDNLARAFGVFLDICMARDAVISGKKRGNIAAGKLNYSPSPGVGHAVNWFIDYDSVVHVFDVGRLAEVVFTFEQLQTVDNIESM